MKLTTVTISNFKALESTRLELHPHMNVLVGANGSGKSSVLQALHWTFQSARNPLVKPDKAGRGSTLAERDAIYLPSLNYLSAGHMGEYGNKAETPQLDVTAEATLADGAGAVSANLSLKAARNEGITVRAPSGNALVTAIRDKNREFSAYIPGVAGIPLAEEKRPKLMVHRLAGAGDANTVLRNILLLLKSERESFTNGIAMVESYVSQVMGPFALKVAFEEDRDSYVSAEFQTGEMHAKSEKAFKPLEFAGIGYLQVLQIFAYLVYFRPRILLVDEPDAHLYPVAQERLIEVLTAAAKEFDAQVLLTTHSPSIVRALPDDSKVIWMSNGKEQPAGDTTGRSLMGWGLLDRRLILLTEDTKNDRLRRILGQDPVIDRAVAVWPVHGVDNLPVPEALKSLADLVGGDVKIVIHRDRDFLMPKEIEAIAGRYRELGFEYWATEHSDIESYWLNPSVIAAHFAIDLDQASDILHEAVAAVESTWEKDFKNKRREAVKRVIAKYPDLELFGDTEALAEAEKHGSQYRIVGKKLLRTVRDKAQRKGYQNVQSFGQRVPEGLVTPVGSDLLTTLTEALSSAPS